MSLFQFCTGMRIRLNHSLVKCCQVMVDKKQSHVTLHLYREAAACMHAQVAELFKDIECGNLDPTNFLGDVETEDFAARLHKL